MKISQQACTTLLVLLTCAAEATNKNKQRSLQDASIVGGNPANDGEYPFYVTDRAFGGSCGASLIHPQIILSAGHCSGAFRRGVRIGDHDISDSDNGVTRRVETEVVHPDYDDVTLENDIMVLKLENPVNSIAPVPYTTSASDPPAGEMLTVIGFGDTFEGSGAGSDALLEVVVNARSNSQCNDEYGSEFFPTEMFCASAAGRDSCQGDSGGPIMDEAGVQVGIVSWGFGCADPDFSGVYTRLGIYDDWIREQICELADTPGVDCSAGPVPDSEGGCSRAIFGGGGCK